MISRLLSAINFMLDAFLLSLCLVFIDKETTVPIVILWLSLSAMAGIVSFFIFLKVPYSLNFSALIALGITSIAIVMGVSVGVVLLFAMVTVYRLHMRFSTNENDGDWEGSYLLKFSVLFFVVLIISLFNPAGDTSETLYALAISLVVFYVASRLLYRYLQVKNENISFLQLPGFSLSILGLSAAGAMLVYTIADDARYVIASLFGRLVSIALWPLAAGMEKMVEYVNGLTTEEQKQQNIEKINLEDPVNKMIDTAQPAADFPLELIFTGVLLVLLVLLVLKLRKVKPENRAKKKASYAEIERFAATSAEPSPETLTITYEAIDLNIVREAFRDFEREAAEAGKGRQNHETAREWLKRMGWSASAAFFNTYDFVRYGKGQISETIALPFLEEIKKIKEKYLNTNV